MGINKSLALMCMASSFLSPISYSYKVIYPSEIVGRDLLVGGLGWLGHIGITTAPISSAKEMQTEAWRVIEVLNEPVVGQINNIELDFRKRSPYWGSKYGLANLDEKGYHVIFEANVQRWWCPKYTTSTAYSIGEGHPQKGASKCGVWRCDTYTWWSFYSAGYNVNPSAVMLPRVIFNYFPAWNPVRNVVKIEDDMVIDAPKSAALDTFTAKEINNMEPREFQMIADIPLEQETPQHIAAEMRLINSDQLNAIKKGVFIDRLAISGKHPKTVESMINTYKTTNSDKVKEKIIQGLMIYYQQHIDLSQNSAEQIELKEFFGKRVKEDFSNQTADSVVRGFIDLHSEEELIANLNSIDSLMAKMPPQSFMTINLSLAMKSKNLEKKYIDSILETLRKENSADLDGYFFGPLFYSYKSFGTDMFNAETTKSINEYLNEVKHKYTSTGVLKQSGDPLAEYTAPIYKMLVDKINK